jgi:hypothetical protein
LPKVLTACEASRSGESGASHLNSSLAVINAVAAYGPDAKGALPVLKRLEIDQLLAIREAAASALEKNDK